MDNVQAVNANTPKDLAEAHDYYLTSRGQYPTTPNKMLLSSMSNLVNFDATNGADKLLTQPLLMIAGDKAESLWQTEQLFSKAKSTNNELFLLKNAEHMDLYDQEAYIKQTIAKLTQFSHHYL